MKKKQQLDKDIVITYCDEYNSMHEILFLRLFNETGNLINIDLYFLRHN